MYLARFANMYGLLPIFVPFQVIFEPTEGATPNSLRQFVSGVCNIPLDRLNIAKYFRQKYDWLVISDSFSRQVCTLIQFMKTQCQCHRKRQITLRHDKYFAIIEPSMNWKERFWEEKRGGIEGFPAETSFPRSLLLPFPGA